MVNYKKVLIYLMAVFITVSCFSLCSITAFASDNTINAKQYQQKSVHLSWEYDSPYEYFELYRNDGASWKKIKRVYDCSAYNYGLAENLQYKYKVHPFYNGVFGEYFGEVSFSLGQEVKAPTNLSAKQTGTNRVRLSWSSVEEADYYVLYRSFDGKDWSRIKPVDSTTTENFSLSENRRYYYKVKAIKGTYYSNSSNIIDFKLNTEWAGPKNLIVKQASATSAYLQWDKVDDIDSYILYRQENGGSWKKIKIVNGTQTFNYSLTGSKYSYKVSVNKSGYPAYSDVVDLSLKSLSSPKSLIATESGNNVKLNWQAVDGADGYVLYRSIDGGNWSEIKKVSSNNTYNYNLVSGKTYRYYLIAYQILENGILYSPKSEIVTYSINTHKEDIGTYRALLIGETSYVQTLNGPVNDVAAMKDILNKAGYEVYSEIDATKNDIVDLVDVAFADATEDDVSLFYYSGHGVTGADEYYSGALQTVDYQYIPTEELAEILCCIPGKVIVILDSCGSGAAISDSSGKTPDPETAFFQNKNSDKLLVQSDSFDYDNYNFGYFSPVQFNNYAIDVFSGYDNITTFSAELRQPKFTVLTGSAYEENSLSEYVNGIWGGLLTRGISSSVGRDFSSGKWYGTLSADKNCDNQITINELYDYCYDFAKKSQNVQCYAGSGDILVFDFQ